MALGLLKSDIKSIDTSSLVDKVEDSLVELLRERKLAVGDVIPKEVELAEALGVQDRDPGSADKTENDGTD